jgi:hypothetical protein
MNNKETVISNKVRKGTFTVIMGIHVINGPLHKSSKMQAAFA